MISKNKKYYTGQEKRKATGYSASDKKEEN
jgi:hypothetical protein